MLACVLLVPSFFSAHVPETAACSMSFPRSFCPSAIFSVHFTYFHVFCLVCLSQLNDGFSRSELVKYHPCGSPYTIWGLKEKEEGSHR